MYVSYSLTIAIPVNSTTISDSPLLNKDPFVFPYGSYTPSLASFSTGPDPMIAILRTQMDSLKKVNEELMAKKKGKKQKKKRSRGEKKTKKRLEAAGFNKEALQVAKAIVTDPEITSYLSISTKVVKKSVKRLDIEERIKNSFKRDEGFKKEFTKMFRGKVNDQRGSIKLKVCTVLLPVRSILLSARHGLCEKSVLKYLMEMFIRLPFIAQLFL